MLRDFKKKKKAEHSFQHFLWMAGAITVLGFCLVLVVADIRMYKKREQLHGQLGDMKTKIEDIETRNDKIKVSQQEMDNPEYLEKVAREEFNLKKPGEKVVSFILPENTHENQSTNQSSGFWGWAASISGWLKGRF